MPQSSACFAVMRSPNKVTACALAQPMSLGNFQVAPQVWNSALEPGCERQNKRSLFGRQNECQLAKAEADTRSRTDPIDRRHGWKWQSQCSV
jgi:hypothetical protein